MARDKAKDDSMFNCSQEHERAYVSGLYGANKSKVEEFLKKKCASKAISNSTHKQVYDLIQKELGYAVPVG